MVYILLGTGFEEAEALVPADILRRGNVPVTLVGVDGMAVTGAHGVTVVADLPVSHVALSAGDLLMLPGGAGVDTIDRSETALELIREARSREDLWLAAICAAPVLLALREVIGPGDHAVCYPSMEQGLIDAGVTPHMEHTVVRDGRLITGKGPGAAYDFGLALLEALKGSEAALTVQSAMHYRR